MGKVVEIRRRYGGKSLPYDAEIEYLESTGTQWIDTGIILQANDTVKVTALCTGLGATDYEYLFGARSGDFRTNAYGVFVVYDRRYLINYNRTGAETRTSIASNVLTKITTEGNLISCVQGSDTYTATTIGTINDTLVNCYIFCANNSGGVVNALAKCRVYDFQIIRDGLLLRDFIPVRVGQIGYMYDKVSKQLFGNSGTGSFILGPDK